MFAGCKDIADKILLEENPTEQKKLGKKIKKSGDLKEWSESRLSSLIFDGNMAKVSSCFGTRSVCKRFFFVVKHASQAPL